jgi:hypothetical protein
MNTNVALSSHYLIWSIPDLGEDLISLVVSRIECYSSCNVLKVENLDTIECGVVGGIYSPNHQNMAVGGLLSHGAPDSPVRHRTLSGAPATLVSRWGSTVGALTVGPLGYLVVHRTGPVDCPVRQLRVLCPLRA